MQNWIKRLLAPSTFPGDAEKTRVASLLNIVLLALSAIFIVNTTVAFLFNPSPAAFWLNAGTIGATVALLVILRRGHVRTASLLTLSVFWVAVAGMALFLTGLSLTIVTSFFVLIVLASALTSQRTMVVFVLLTLVTVSIAAYLQIAGRVTPPLAGSFLVNVTSGAGNLVAMAVILYLTSTALQRALQDLQVKNQALAEVQANLEVRIAERTRDLALAAEVGRNLAQVRDLDRLLQEASELIRERFNLYHVQIYLADVAQQTLILRGGAGQAARELLSRGHKLTITLGSINGSAALNKRPMIVTDTRASAIFRPNPLLPNTRSEMAVPLLIGSRVLGVLDLQSAEANSLTEEVLPAFTTVASQLAVSIENADLFTAASQARAEVESYLQRLTREGWADYLDAINRGEKLAYTYDSAESAAKSSPGMLPVSAGPNALQLPISVADESIGLIQVEADDNRHWTEDALALVSAVAQQVAQQVENLRLLEEAQRYRAEAETAIRRMTHEGWQAYVQDGTAGPRGYLYDQDQVRPLSDVIPGRDAPTLEQPVQVHGQTIGNLALYGSNLTPEAANLLQLVGARLGDHLENLRLSQQTEQALAETADQARRLALLNEASSKLGAATQEDEVIQLAISYSTRLFDAPDVTLTLLNQATQMMELYGLDDTTGRVTLKQALPDNKLAGTATSTAMKRSDLVYIPDLRQDQHVESAQLANTGLRSSLLAPLTTWHGPLGTLNVASPKVNAFAGARQQNLMVQFAALLVTTIEERRLLAAVQSQAEKERVVNAISQRIQGTFTMEEALQTAVAELGNALQAHYTQVTLHLSTDENGNGTAQHSTVAR